MLPPRSLFSLVCAVAWHAVHRAVAILLFLELNVGFRLSNPIRLLPEPFKHYNFVQLTISAEAIQVRWFCQVKEAWKALGESLGR